MELSKKFQNDPRNPPKYGCCAKIISSDSTSDSAVLAGLAGLAVLLVPFGVAMLLGVAVSDFEVSGLETSSTVTGPSLHSSTCNWDPVFFRPKQAKQVLSCYCTVTPLLDSKDQSSNSTHSAVKFYCHICHKSSDLSSISESFPK